MVFEVKYILLIQKYCAHDFALCMLSAKDVGAWLINFLCRFQQYDLMEFLADDIIFYNNLDFNVIFPFLILGLNCEERKKKTTFL